MSLEHPNWNSSDDRRLYEELFYKKSKKELTQKEEDFITRMYHMEEFACGLDGD